MVIKKKNDNNGSANNEHNDSEHDNCISEKETTTNETLTSNNSTPNVKQNKIAVSQSWYIIISRKLIIQNLNNFPSP